MFENYRLHHVGIVLPSIEDAERHMASFGLVEDYRGYVAPWQCWCIFTKPQSGAAIELVVADGGPLTRFNKGRAFVTTPETLGDYVLVDFIESKRAMVRGRATPRRTA